MDLRLVFSLPSSAEVADAGGNSIRFWLHVQGNVSPNFGGDGYVTGTDQQNTLIPELRDLLDFAASKNVFVIICLWNGAYIDNQNAVNIVINEGVLNSYLENALRPMVSGVGEY